MRTERIKSIALQPIRGFTLIELLVAIAITAVLIVFAGQVLTHISSATSQGAAISQVIQGARVITDQLQDDFDQMVGPGPGQNGVLVIVNYEIPAVRFTEDDLTRSEILNLPTPQERLPYIRRADQIMFIRSAGNLEPLCPLNRTVYSNSSGAPYARVWYGHVLRTDENGLGPTGAVGTPDFGKEGIPDEFAANWMLGRQALFLDPMGPADQSNENHLRGEPPGPMPASPSTIGAASYNAIASPGLAAPAAVRRLYYGISDVASIGLHESGEHSDYGAITADTQPAMGEKNLDQLYRYNTVGPPGNNIFSPANYSARAYSYMFMTQRLRYNPLPNVNYDGNSNWSDSFQAWQIAQMHPMFVANVVDFEISFAGDYDATAGIDRDPSPNGPIKWYDMNTAIPVTANGFAQANSAGTASENPIWDQNAPTLKAGDPVHNPSSEVFIFRHGPTATNARWPHLIRIRYRIVDPNARVLGADGQPGRIFEQILSVPQ